MGQLPGERITITCPFSTFRVYFMGHFNMKCLNHRLVKINKAYVAIFVCFVTRAVHIELISKLSTAMFLQGLAHMCARRGKPNRILSDNGRNFLGASNVLYTQRDVITRWCQQESINWQFIVSNAPHQGGLRGGGRC